MVVNTFGPRRRSCAGTQTKSNQDGGRRGSWRTAAKVFPRERRRIMEALLAEGFSQSDLARELGVNDKAIRKGLTGFGGVRRRFTTTGVSGGGVRVVDDYGHHPVEMAATLAAARGGRRLFVDFRFDDHEAAGGKIHHRHGRFVER